VDSSANINEELNFGDELTKDISYLFDDVDIPDEMTFRAANLPKGLSIDPHSGIISGKAVEPGRFGVVLTATDAAGASVSRTFEMLVIAPPAPPAPAPEGPAGGTGPADMDVTKAETPSRELIRLNERADEAAPEKDTNANADAEPQQMQNGNGADDGLDLNNVELTSISSSTGGNPNDKVVQADVDLNVGTDGKMNFGEKAAESFETVGLTIETIDFADNNVEIKIIDTRVGQKYMATLSDGSPLPSSLSFDPNTGVISGELPEGTENLDISIRATSSDGTTRILNMKLDVKELKEKSGQNTNNEQAKFESLKEQIVAQNDKMNNYGSYIASLFNGSEVA
jgi:hypothetical protein